MFAVPGNHDVDCERCLQVSWQGVAKRNQETFFVEDDAGKKLRANRAAVFEAYRDFVNANGIISPDPLAQVSLLYEPDDLPVGILATNTAFFSDKSEDSSKPTTPVPLSSLRQVIKSGTPKKPLLILGHHSPSSFFEDQGRQFTSMLSDKKAILLHGHEHNPRASFNFDGTLRTLGFGASYIGSMGSHTQTPYQNSFTYCRILDNRLRVNSYSWEPTVGRWVDRTETHFAECIPDKGYKGYAEIKLPILSEALGDSLPVVISNIPRNPAKVSRLIPVGAPVFCAFSA